MLGLLLVTYFILSTILAYGWLGWDIPFCCFGFAIVPLAVLLLVINKIFHKRVIIDGIEISYE